MNPDMDPKTLLNAKYLRFGISSYLAKTITSQEIQLDANIIRRSK
jgi:hypothetical protein